MLWQSADMDNDELAGADRPRELVALIQRRSLAFLPVWASLVVVGFTDPVSPGGRYLIPAAWVLGFAAMFVLRQWHQRWYGDAKLTESQRFRGRLGGLALLLAFIATPIVAPLAVPSPMPLTFAVVFALSLLSDPWRVSLHWLLLIAVLLWLSVIRVVGPDALATSSAFSLLIGAAGSMACVIDHVLLLRRIRQAPGAMMMGEQHA
jgi:hypothetical protein